MKAGIVISISVGLALVLAGCSQDRTLSGMWQGDRDWRKLHLDNEEIARARAAINLSLKSDGTFVLQDGGEPFTGTWSKIDTGVHLEVETYMNRPIQQQLTETHSSFVVRVDGKRMFFKNSSDETEIELKKQAKP